jgi:hypothetical protein
VKLSRPPPAYDVNDQGQLRAALEMADAQNHKKGRDVDLTASGVKLYLAYATSITAHAGGGKASATVLTAMINHVTACATAADSLLLMPATAGLRVSIHNYGAQAAQVFGQGTDTINDVATATGVSQAAGKSALYDCPADGKWYRVLSA